MIKDIILHIRSKANKKISAKLDSITDQDLCKRMFYSPKSNRLTQFGIELMKGFFKEYIIIRQNNLITINEILYLDKACKLPYFLSRDKIVVFETEIAVILTLVEGNISKLNVF